MASERDNPHPSGGPTSGQLAIPSAVLVAHDDDALRALVVRWLSKAGLRCVEARSGDEALEKASAMAAQLDAIVCDVMMPGLDGFGVIARLKADPGTRLVPIVLLTAHATAETDIVRGVELGAVDHLAKPFSGPVLVAKLRAVCERARAERALRTKLRFAEEHATIDALTGLYNRRHFDSCLRAETKHAQRHRRALSLVLFDIDHFKAINDTFGHAEGDRVLRHVADITRTVLRTEDMAFRYGGEEFVLLLRACSAESAAGVSERLRAELRMAPIALGDAGEPRLVTFSGGISAVEESNAFDDTSLVERADAALYRAKRAGRDRVELA